MKTISNRIFKGYKFGYSLKGAVFGLLLVFSIGSVGSAWAVVPNPNVIGPISSSVQPGDPSHDYIFAAASDNLKKAKYVEEEYFLDGTANHYVQSDIDGGVAAAILDSGNAYKTRIIVRRPISAKKFNGTVIVEPINAAFGFDINVAWAKSSDFLMREGYAWVGISEGTGALQAWAAPSGRYDSLNVPDSGLLYDIYSQTAQAIRHPVGIDPMKGLKVKRIILNGFSYVGTTVTNYHNSIQQNANVFDGFMIIHWGYAIRTDLPNPVPVVRLLSETEVAYSFLADTTQPDSAFFRLWQVAGDNHYDIQVNNYNTPIFMRDGVSIPGSVCNDPNTGSLIPGNKVHSAAISGMNRWIKHGIVLPSAPPIEVDANGIVQRDSDGNALGGIQLAEQKVATATNTQNSGGGLCFLAGAHAPFSQQRLDELYPTHGYYVFKVLATTLHNLHAGYILEKDAVDTIVDAAKSDVGR